MNIDKLIEKMKNQPHGIRVDEADKVLTYCKFVKERQRGSHRQYRNHNGDKYTLPDNKNPIKRVYVEGILEIYEKRGDLK